MNPDESITYQDRSYHTLKAVNLAQGWKPLTATGFFYNHRDLFKRDKDYIELSFSEWNKITSGKPFTEHGGLKGKIILLSEEGINVLASSVKTSPSDQKEKPKDSGRKAKAKQKSEALISINGKEVSPLTYDGQRVVTFSMIDEVHGRPKNTASRNFKQNRHRFTEGAHYYHVTRENSLDEFRLVEIPPAGITLLSERGYFKLVKSFNDDLAWEIYEKMVDAYFTVRDIAKATERASRPSRARGLKR
ncbi:MAG: ORF6N domain protein [Syntrophorhabdus sp. PtaU1.Bin153]|nr:MAG: ORF6N domain protein [Syntrophorhabdus sp. PtaU1.Bin153]